MNTIKEEFFDEISQPKQKSQLYSSVKLEDMPSQMQKRTRNKTKIEDFDHLFVALDRFQRFLSELGELKNSPIHQSFLQYYKCSKRRGEYVSIDICSEIILDKMKAKIKKLITTKKHQKDYWLEEQTQILIWILSKYFQLHDFQDIEQDMTEEDWAFISSIYPGTTPNKCKFKWLSLKKVTILEYQWDQDESCLLKNIIHEYRKRNNRKPQDYKRIDWKNISQELYEKNHLPKKVFRSAKLCKEHWSAFLNEDIKRTCWEPIEDYILIQFLKENNGQKKWSLFAYQFKHRNENAIKNRYNVIIDKMTPRYYSKKNKKTQSEKVKEYEKELIQKHPEIEFEYKKKYGVLIEDIQVDYRRFDTHEMSEDKEAKDKPGFEDEIKPEIVQKSGSEEENIEEKALKCEESWEVANYFVPTSDKNSLLYSLPNKNMKLDH